MVKTDQIWRKTSARNPLPWWSHPSIHSTGRSVGKRLVTRKFAAAIWITNVNRLHSTSYFKAHEHYGWVSLSWKMPRKWLGKQSTTFDERNCSLQKKSFTSLSHAVPNELEIQFQKNFHRTLIFLPGRLHITQSLVLSEGKKTFFRIISSPTLLFFVYKKKIFCMHFCNIMLMYMCYEMCKERERKSSTLSSFLCFCWVQWTPGPELWWLWHRGRENQRKNCWFEGFLKSKWDDSFYAKLEKILFI